MRENFMRRFFSYIEVRPPAAAQNLSKRANNIVGVIIPEAHNPFFAEILAGISNVADANKGTYIGTEALIKADAQSQQSI